MGAFYTTSTPPGSLLTLLPTHLQVVLPMLYNQCVDHTCVDPTSGAMIDCPVPSQSWMSTSQFYAGLALAQGE